MKNKAEIKTYGGKVYALKLNYFLQQLEVYFNVYNMQEDNKIFFARVKPKNHAQNSLENIGT
jgi:hypothetical protein